MKINDTKLKNNVFLAPMAGVTDKSFRALCVEMGAGLTYSEMVSAKGLKYGSKNTKVLIDVHEKEKNVGIQIFGRDENIMASMAEILSKEDITLIDINMGCPATKIVKNKEGSALLKEPEQISKIVKEVVKYSHKPVTVKIRKGFNDDLINGVEISKIIEDSGASAITIHGRTREEYYSGEADWDIIKEIKENISIPVIGNGDIVDGKSAKKMLDYTGCDGIMIGRASMGNPWIFREVLYYLETGKELERPSYRERIDMAMIHLDMLIEHKGEVIGIREMRTHMSNYLMNMPNSSYMRNEINKINTYSELEDNIYTYLDSIEKLENN